MAQLDVLRTHGIGRADVLEARKAGLAHRVRRAWYAVPDADPRLVAAVTVGGSVTCVTAAGLHGLWEVPDARLHVALAGNAARLRSLDEHAEHPSLDPRLVLHWRDRTWCPIRPVQSLEHVLQHVVECQPIEMAVAVLDSALRKGIPKDRLASWLTTTKGRAAVRESDVRGEAGGESIARVRLRRAGFVVTPQVEVPGIGRIDIKVGDRLLVEIDSRAHHARIEQMGADRGRDNEALRQGFVPLRFMHKDVIFAWPRVEATIRSFADRDQHRRRAS